MENKQKLLIAVLAVIVLASLGTAYYFYNQVNELKINPQKAAQEEAKALVDQVAKLIVLPEGEDPTIATVTDPDKLKDQPFFAKAKKGDKVLIYSNARKAILYDPIDNKIIEVAPVNIGPTAAPAPTPPPAAEKPAPKPSQ